MMHSLLRRQIKKHLQGSPALEGPLLALIEAVDAAYHEFDDDRRMLERSLDLSSRELLQANADARAIFQAFPDLFFRLDGTGRILDTKGDSAGDFALPAEDLLGRRIQDAPGTGAQGIIQDAIRRVATARAPVSIEFAMRIHGRDLSCEARFVPVLEDQIIVIVRNITDRKLFEHSLARRQERLVRYQAALHDLAVMGGADLDASLHRIAEASARTLQVARVGIWLYTEDHTHMVCAALHHQDAASSDRGHGLEASRYPRYFTALEEGRAIAADDARSDARTNEFAGEYLEALGVTSMLDVPVRLHGRIVGVVCHEHTGPRRAWEMDEQSFAASIADLVSLAVGAAKRRALEEQLRQSQKMEAIGLLAGGVAHDFNNNLTAILGYCEMMHSMLPAGNPLREQSDQVRKAAERAAALTRQLLAFGRRQILDPRILDLGDLVGNLRDMLQRIIGEDIRLITLTPSPVGRVRADPGQIEQVIMNLSVNARDAMPSGGKLTIELRDVGLDPAEAERLGGIRAGGYVMISVSDTGSGMDETTRQRVFEPFFTTKDAGKGTGLGLSMVHGIVRQSGGQIEVHSEAGRGSVFRVYLPHADGEQDPRAVMPPRPPAAARTGEAVLVVEDEEMVLNLTCGFLERQGYQVLAASHPGEALLICEQHRGPIHLVLTDIVMPVMDGRELAQRLQQIRPGLGVLYMSGYAETGIVRGGTLEPGTRFIQKPFTLATLARKVRQALDAAAAAGPAPAGAPEQAKRLGA